MAGVGKKHFIESIRKIYSRYELIVLTFTVLSLQKKNICKI